MIFKARGKATSDEIELTAIVPTRNRGEALSDLLESITQQDLDAQRFEILIIDDGSGGEQLRAVEKVVADGSWRFPVALCSQKNHGPAVARNRMVQEAHGEIVLFLNDDVTLNTAHFSTHLRLHQQEPKVNVAVRGTTHWQPVARANAVTRYLCASQCLYDAKVPPGWENFVYFHTCDLSLKRSLLLAHPFDKDFPYASLEDTELGYRLYREADLRLIITPDAVSTHRHDYTARAFVRRARTNGRAAAILIEKHPDLRDFFMDQHYVISRRRRIFRALGRLALGRMMDFWAEVDQIVYLRNLDHELTRRERLR